MKKITAILLSAMLVAIAAQATTLLVPSQYHTIQSGIDDAVEGDTVLVADGTYTGTGNKNIDFLGKAIVVISENGTETCNIDCESDGRGFHFHSGENSNSVLSGFNVTNGYADNGGCICCENSSPLILNCVFIRNFAGGGGGVYSNNGSPIFENCIITENSADYLGGGVYLHGYDNHTTFFQCIIIGNSTPGYSYGGGGIE